MVVVVVVAMVVVVAVVATATYIVVVVVAGAQWRGVSRFLRVTGGRGGHHARGRRGPADAPQSHLLQPQTPLRPPHTSLLKLARRLC